MELIFHRQTRSSPSFPLKSREAYCDKERAVMNDSLISCANAISRRICEEERERERVDLAICKVANGRATRHRFISLKLGGNEICYWGWEE